MFLTIFTEARHCTVFGITVELCYNVVKGYEHFASFLRSVVITEKCNVMVDSVELIGTMEYQTLQARCRIN
jgi:hypothetical protein